MKSICALLKSEIQMKCTWQMYCTEFKKQTWRISSRKDQSSLRDANWRMTRRKQKRAHVTGKSVRPSHLKKKKPSSLPPLRDFLMAVGLWRRCPEAAYGDVGPAQTGRTAYCCHGTDARFKQQRTRNDKKNGLKTKTEYGHPPRPKKKPNKKKNKEANG